MSDDDSPDVYDISLQTARQYTAGFTPKMEYRTFTNRFEIHLQNWAKRDE